MTIDVHQPELEALIQQRMATGRFQDVEDVLLQALRNAPDLPRSNAYPSPEGSLVDMFAKVRGLFADEELDFSRDPSPGDPVDLS